MFISLIHVWYFIKNHLLLVSCRLSKVSLNDNYQNLVKKQKKYVEITQKYNIFLSQFLFEVYRNVKIIFTLKKLSLKVHVI